MSTKKFIPLLMDRSGAELDDKCGMARWWNRHEGKRGIVSTEEAIELKVGSQIHEDMEWVALNDISEGSLLEKSRMMLSLDSPDLRQEERELIYRRVGWLLAYALFIEPTVRLKYETIKVEGELILERDPLWTPITPDRVLRDRGTGQLVYREYKTTISASYKWLNHWPYAIQLHVGMAAIEEEFNEKVAFAQVMGLMKGNNDSGRLSHPYVWGYFNDSKGEWQFDYTKARGNEWRHRPIWEFPGGPLEWVKFCGKDIALSQFPHTGPVFLNHDMLSDWVLRRTNREREIENVVDKCRDSWEDRVIYFEPRTSQCRPAFGAMCPYISLCWNAERRRDPLGKGDFKEREPHHMVEVIMSGD